MQALQFFAGAAGVARLFRPPRPIHEELAELGIDCRDPNARSSSQRAPLPGARATLPLVDGDLGAAVQRAHSEARFLLVYIHSSQNENTKRFCEDTLTDGDVIATIMHHYVFWACNAQSEEGWTLLSRLGGAGFPFLAVLYVKNPTMFHSIYRMDGAPTPAVLSRILTNCQDECGALLAAQRADQTELVQARQVREEQEQAMREAQRIDAEAAARAQAEQAAAARAEQERLEREAEEARERAAQESAAREFAERLEREREQARQSIPQEPDPGPDTTTLRVTMLTGRSVERRFLRSDTVRSVRDFILAQEDYDGRNFCVSPAFPPRPLELGATLQECGLVPRAVVIAKEVFPEE